MDLPDWDWQWHGFASQGFTYTTENQVFGTSKQGSFDFSEVGINNSLRPLPNLLISAQGLFRTAGASDHGNFRLDFAQADYHVSLAESALTLGVRGGRVKVPFGLYNDTRDVIWTRSSILMPQSVYFDTLALRQAMIAADGGLLYGRYNQGDHRFSLEFMTAEPQDSSGGAPEFLTGIRDVRGSFGGRPMLLGRAAYEWMGGRARFMFSYVDLDRDFKSAMALVPSGKVKAAYPLFSLQYNAERWSLTAEYGWIDTTRSGFTPVLLKNTSEGYYLQGEYRIDENWSAVMRWDVSHADIDDRSGRTLARATGLPRTRFFTRDLMAGLRWEFRRNWMVAAEYHNVYGTSWLAPRDNPNLQRGTDPHWDLLALMLSVRF